MTKEEAIRFIQSCSDNSSEVYGFMVEAVGSDDVATYASSDTYEAFARLSDREKETTLSKIADVMDNDFNEYGGFYSLFIDVAGSVITAVDKD